MYCLWLSVAVLAFTTGFVSATISYDWDTSPEKRQYAPDFHGFVPTAASKRVVKFASMLFLSAGKLVIRSMVLLGSIERNWALAYAGADVGLYLIIKVLKVYFWYSSPAGGYVEIVSSTNTRISVKIITHFTSLVQERHPQRDMKGKMRGKLVAKLGFDHGKSSSSYQDL